MKGIILAGGSGSRLKPITNYLNKHLLPVYDKPMILFPLETMKSVGIRDIVIVTDRYRGEKIIEFLGSGSEYGLRLTYKFQDQPDGIGNAISLCESYIGKENSLVMLGDNILLDDISLDVNKFSYGCKVFLKDVSDPERFGIAEFDKSGNIVNLVEKPINPKSNYAVTGIYIFDDTVFKKIKNCSASARGELEIIDILNQYVVKGNIKYRILNDVWFDAGTFESLYSASAFVRDSKRKK